MRVRVRCSSMWWCDGSEGWPCDSCWLCSSRFPIFTGNGTNDGAVHSPFHWALVLPLAGNVSQSHSALVCVHPPSSAQLSWVRWQHSSDSLIDCTISSPQRVNLELMNLRASAAVPYQTLAAAQLPATLQHYTNVLEEHRSAIIPIVKGSELDWASWHSEAVYIITNWVDLRKGPTSSRGRTFVFTCA